MRRSFWISGAATPLWGMVLAAATAWGQGIEPGCPSCGSYHAYTAGACGAPCGFSLAPGCCECPCHPCDNAWDGYCERKACKQAFYARVGTPKPRCCRPRWLGGWGAAEACTSGACAVPLDAGFAAEPAPAASQEPAGPAEPPPPDISLPPEPPAAQPEPAPEKPSPEEPSAPDQAAPQKSARLQRLPRVW